MLDMILSADVPDMARTWRNDPKIWRWCRQHTLISAEEQADWKKNSHEDRTIKMFGIEADCGPVGVCGFTSINRLSQSAEFSLYIAPEYHRLGCGILSLELLLEHGFKDWNFNRIWGEVFDGNPAMHMFEKLGFKKEGVLRQTYYREGRFINSTIISILRDEWKKSLYSLPVT